MVKPLRNQLTLMAEMKRGMRVADFVRLIGECILGDAYYQQLASARAARQASRLLDPDAEVAPVWIIQPDRAAAMVLLAMLYDDIVYGALVAPDHDGTPASRSDLPRISASYWVSDRVSDDFLRSRVQVTKSDLEGENDPTGDYLRAGEIRIFASLQQILTSLGDYKLIYFAEPERDLRRFETDWNALIAAGWRFIVFEHLQGFLVPGPSGRYQGLRSRVADAMKAYAEENGWRAPSEASAMLYARAIVAQLKKMPEDHFDGQPLTPELGWPF